MEFVFRPNAVSETSLLLGAKVSEIYLFLDGVVMDYDMIFLCDVESPKSAIYLRIDFGPTTFIFQNVPPFELSR